MNQQQKKITYLALGDSYTIGEQVAKSASFPNQVMQMLNRTCHDLMCPPDVVAVTGWTTDELDKGIDAAAIQPNYYDWVSLLIGVNNQYRKRCLKAYTEEFEALLKRAISFSKNGAAGVIVLSIPDWGATPFAQTDGKHIPEEASKEIAAYNRANKQIATSYKVHYIDITPSTILNGLNKTHLVADLLHYSEKEYAIWATAIAQLISDQKSKLNET